MPWHQSFSNRGSLHLTPLSRGGGPFQHQPWVLTCQQRPFAAGWESPFFIFRLTHFCGATHNFCPPWIFHHSDVNLGLPLVLVRQPGMARQLLNFCKSGFLFLKISSLRDSNPELQVDKNPTNLYTTYVFSVKIIPLAVLYWIWRILMNFTKNF